MEECFLSNKGTLQKPTGGNFTTRETEVISCLINGGTAKSISNLLGISDHTARNYIESIRSALGFCSKEQVIKFVESSGKYVQIRERYVDLLLFQKFEEILKKIKSLKKVKQKYKCVFHLDIGDVSKCVLLDYLRLAGIEVDISYDSTHYENDKFHIICCSEGSQINLENLANNIVVNENHHNDVINLVGKCIKLTKSGTLYSTYFGLLGCISKIYSSQEVDDILNEFKEYYHNVKEERPQTNLERNHIEITDKRKSKHLASFFIAVFVALATTYWYAHWYNESHKTTTLTNINMLVGEDIFLKRKDLTYKMDQILDAQKGVKFLILVGQGGAGKTTLAKHYIRTNNAKIKWEMNSETEESTIKSFLQLAIELSKTNSKKRDELKYIQAIEDPEIKKQSVISFVFSQLKVSGEWCLLFDNVDDFKMIYGFILPNKDVCNEGTIVITTRNANCDNTSFVSSKSVLSIGYLEKDEMGKLFCDILYDEQRELSEDKIKEIDKFLENIPPMPLDVSNAAYYIKNTDGSFEKYLEILKSPNKETDNLHSKFLNEGMEYNKTRYKMTLAVFNKLIEINPNFKELLLFICLLDSKNIPKKYLEQCKGFIVVSDFLQNLKRFFSINLNNARFSIHKSIQEIGLVYLAGILTNYEKDVFLKKIIGVMTPYNAILWEKYKTYPYKMEQNDIDELEAHITSMINNLKLLKFPMSGENEYLTKLLLAKGFIYGEDNLSQAKHFLKRALKYNENNEYIGNYEYAIALLALGYAHLDLDEFEDAKLWLNKGLEFCKKLKDAEILKAYGLCDLGRYYARNNEFGRAIELLEKALSIVDNNQENWARKTSAEICAGLSHTYADHYINKPEGNNAIVYAQKSFKKLGLENYLHNKVEKVKKSEVDSGKVYFRVLAKAYNRMGKYDSAQKCSNSYYNLYEKYFKNDDYNISKALIDIEYGYTLLRKGELTSALSILNRAINIKQEYSNCYLFRALVSRTEALIRLNKLDEAYLDFQYAISQKSNITDNYTRLLFCTSLYHAFIIKYKQKDYKLAFEHFSDFCSSIKEFCKGFLSVSEYNKLLNAGAFEIISNESQIKTSLHNSVKVFTSIYGDSHPFVKEYASKNIN